MFLDFLSPFGGYQSIRRCSFDPETAFRRRKHGIEDDNKQTLNISVHSMVVKKVDRDRL